MGVVEGNTFSGVVVAMGVGAVLNSTRWALGHLKAARRVEVAVLKEVVEEMVVWIGEPRGHAVVTWVEVAVRTIARGHGQVEMAEVEVETGVVVKVVVRGQRSGEGEAKGVSRSVGAVEEVMREAAVGAVETEAEAGVGVHLKGVVPGVVAAAAVPRSVEVVGVATLPATTARSARTQS